MCRCSIHVAVEMVFTEPSPCGNYHMRKRGVNSKEEAEELNRIRNRKGLLRCPVATCFRVETVEEKQEVKLCPKCKQKSDAPRYRAMIGDHVCKNCRRQLTKRWKRNRLARKLRTQTEIKVFTA